MPIILEQIEKDESVFWAGYENKFENMWAATPLSNVISKQIWEKFGPGYPKIIVFTNKKVIYFNIMRVLGGERLSCYSVSDIKSIICGYVMKKKNKEIVSRSITIVGKEGNILPVDIAISDKSYAELLSHLNKESTNAILDKIIVLSDDDSVSSYISRKAYL